MLVLVALCVNLGLWQWGKAERKSAAQAQLDTLAQEGPISLPATPVADPDLFHYRRVTVRGHYRTAGQILLDNQMMSEKVGYRVLTPFVIGGGSTEVLVDRGWVPAGIDRNRLPDQLHEAAVLPSPTFLIGTAVLPSRKIFVLAPDTAPPDNNARWQALDLERYAREARVTLQPLIVRLDPDQPGGYLRIWSRPDDRHERHRSYAFQWFGFAASAVAIWAWAGLRRKQ